jgi:hypothetical protein
MGAAAVAPRLAASRTMNPKTGTVTQQSLSS